MTSDQFRASSENVVALRELLQNPVLAQAIVVLQDESPKGDRPLACDAIESVRWLSRGAGWSDCIRTLLELAEPLPAPPKQDEMPWAHIAKE